MYGPGQGGPYGQQGAMHYGPQGGMPPQGGYYAGGPPGRQSGGGKAGGLAAGLCAGLAACCCLDMLF